MANKNGLVLGGVLALVVATVLVTQAQASNGGGGTPPPTGGPVLEASAGPSIT